MKNDVLIKVENVSKKFSRDLKKSLWYGIKDIGGDLIGSSNNNVKLRKKEFWALENISFELKRGEVLGLIGRNGAGKTTLLKLLNGLTKPDSGKITMRGRVGALIALGAGFNPILTGRENVYVNGSVLGLTKKEIDTKFDEIVDFAELWDFIDTPVQSYSSGMQIRLGFAVSTAMNPDVLLLDEVLAVGDAAFRAKCFKRIGKLLNNCAVVFVSHNETQMRRISRKCLYLKRGKLIGLGITDNIFDRYIEENKHETKNNIVELANENVHFECRILTKQINSGDSCDILLKIDTGNIGEFGLALVTLKAGEIPVSQSDITTYLNEVGNRSEALYYRLGPLFLKEGKYYLAVSIFDKSMKGTIAHAPHCDTLEVSGSKGWGVYYQPACMPKQ